MTRAILLATYVMLSISACDPATVEPDAPAMDAPTDIGRDAGEALDTAPELDTPRDTGADLDGGADADLDSGADADLDGGDDACSCDDGVLCTMDRCSGGSCAHEIDHRVCPAGQYCDPVAGCRLGGACAVVADCARPDPCLTVRCDVSMARCTYALLDVDGDGHSPEVCGGDDCNDTLSTVFGGAPELCDRADQDCDEAIDEDNAMTTACGDQSTCTDGNCRCPDELDWCATGSFPSHLCVDTATDPNNCGYCGLRCPAGVGCIDGACACPDGGTFCTSNYACSDLATDPMNCGRCGDPCPAGVACTGGRCACPSGTRSCGTSCVDLSTDRMNCGGCFAQCPDGLTCADGACVCPTGGVACGLYSSCGDLADGLDTFECGTCANNCVGEGAGCVGGECTCPGDACLVVGRFGYTSTVCTDVRSDVSHCGACNTPCPYPLDCVDGLCTGCAEEYGFVECNLRLGGLTCVQPDMCPL